MFMEIKWKLVARATAEGLVLSIISNILGQVVDCWNQEIPFRFSPIGLLQFIILHLLTAPPNYLWQQFLEECFPARAPASSHAYHSIPLAERDEEQPVPKDHDSNIGDDEEPEGEAPRKRRRKFNYRNIAIKWFTDCITLGAIMNTTAFIVIMGVLKGHGPSKIWENMKGKTLKIIIDGYKLWPFANIIAHTWVPVEWRIQFFSLMGLLWNIYLSIMAAQL